MIAIARRLDAVETALDVRPAPKARVMPLSSKFLAVEEEEFENERTAGG